MRTIELDGHIVSDAQVKSSKNGRAYVEFRFANNEYSDKDNPFYARVVSFDNKYVNLAEYYKKGKPLYIMGDYSNKVYSTQDGKCSVDNNIVAFKIDFPKTGNRDNQPQATATDAIPTVTTTSEAKPAPTPKATTTTKKKTTAKAAPTPVVTDEEDDDLPF